jgi:uncharacterized SAM-binding protein YcdF (DUF218 family)
MIHIIKYVAGALAAPLVLAPLIALLAAAFRISGRCRTAAWLLVSAAAVVYLGAMGLVGNTLLRPLEGRYPPLQDTSLPPVGYVVVLGSSYTPHDGVTVTAALDSDGLARIVEGVRLARRLAVRLIVSGGAPRGKTPAAFGYAKLAHDLGIDDASLFILPESLDTADEARSVVSMVGTAPFILVTSAYHMPRAMLWMRRVGAHAVPAPTGQLVNESARYHWDVVLPSSNGLQKSERALHEYLGLAALAAGVEQ